MSNNIYYKNKIVRLESVDMDKRFLTFFDLSTGDLFRADGYGDWLYVKLSQSALCFNTASIVQFKNNIKVEKYVGDILLDDRDFEKYK